MPEPLEPLNFTVPEAARYIGVSPRTYYTLMDRKRDPAPSHLVAGLRKVSRKRLEAWNERQAGGPK